MMAHCEMPLRMVPVGIDFTEKEINTSHSAIIRNLQMYRN